MVGFALAPAVMIFGDHLFGAHHPDRLGEVLGKRKVGLTPKLDLPFLAWLPFGKALIGFSFREQCQSVPIEVAVFLFQRNDQIPTHVLGQF